MGLQTDLGILSLLMAEGLDYETSKVPFQPKLFHDFVTNGSKQSRDFCARALPLSPVPREGPGCIHIPIFRPWIHPTSPSACLERLNWYLALPDFPDGWSRDWPSPENNFGIKKQGARWAFGISSITSEFFQKKATLDAEFQPSLIPVCPNFVVYLGKKGKGTLQAFPRSLETLSVPVHIPKGWIAPWRRRRRPGSPRSGKTGKKEQEHAPCVASGVLSSRKTVAQSPSPGLSTRNSGVLLDRALAWDEQLPRDSFPFPPSAKKKKSEKSFPHLED